MAKFQFGVTQEDIEKEQAAKQQALEAEIRERVSRRNDKLFLLNKKTKRNRAIVITTFIIFFLAMLTFGTYNTFFKQQLSKKEIINLIATETHEMNTDGIEGFLHDNIATLFQNYAAVTGGSYDYANIEPDSVRINKILPLTSDTAIVIFSANFESKKSNEVVEKEDNKREEELVIGSSGYTRYQFRLVIQYVEDMGGYKPVSQLALNPFAPYDTVEIEESPLLSFKEIEKVEDKEAVNDMLLKTDRVLADLYEGKDPGAEYEGKVLFEPGQTYMGISEFTVYQETNGVGCNAYIKYNVTTKDGIEYSNTAYANIVKNGDSYKIERFI